MMRTKGELKKAFPTLRQLIDSLWRNYYGLYRESYLDPPDLDELGEPIDPWQKNRISRDIRHGQALGQDNLIEGNRSAAFGQGNNTKSFLEIILGANALIPEGQNPEEWIPTDLLLTLGNGPDPEHRSNVFEIYKNGIFRFLLSIVIGAHPELPEGQTPYSGSVQFKNNMLQVYYLGAWHPIGNILVVNDYTTLVEVTENTVVYDLTTNNFYTYVENTWVVAGAREIELSVQSGWLCWRYVGDTEWTQLYEIATPPAETAHDVHIKFEVVDTYEYICPYAMKLTAINYQNGMNPTVSAAVNDELAQYDTISVTPILTGLVTLTFEWL